MAPSKNAEVGPGRPYTPEGPDFSEARSLTRGSAGSSLPGSPRPRPREPLPFNQGQRDTSAASFSTITTSPRLWKESYPVKPSLRPYPCSLQAQVLEPLYSSLVTSQLNESFSVRFSPHNPHPPGFKVGLNILENSPKLLRRGWPILALSHLILHPGAEFAKQLPNASRPAMAGNTLKHLNQSLRRWITLFLLHLTLVELQK